MSRSQHDVTKLLRQWRRGDKEALDKLTPLVYEVHREIFSPSIDEES